VTNFDEALRNESVAEGRYLNSGLHSATTMRLDKFVLHSLNSEELLARATFHYTTVVEIGQSVAMRSPLHFEDWAILN
jgi:hypothetical protein